MSDILTCHTMKPPLYVNIETVYIRLLVICFVWSPNYTSIPFSYKMSLTHTRVSAASTDLLNSTMHDDRPARATHSMKNI
jgi:hypothetical protein